MILKSIFEDYNKLWKIYQAALEGLDNVDKLKNFKLDMGTFGDNVLTDYDENTGRYDRVCVGCLATCTIFNIVGEQPNHTNIYIYR